jgi:hypothetical protein
MENQIQEMDYCTHAGHRINTLIDTLCSRPNRSTAYIAHVADELGEIFGEYKKVLHERKDVFQSSSYDCNEHQRLLVRIEKENEFIQNTHATLEHAIRKIFELIKYISPDEVFEYDDFNDSIQILLEKIKKNCLEVQDELLRQEHKYLFE